MADNVQKTPLAISLTRFTGNEIARAQQLLGKSMPAQVETVEENGTIVTVSFQIESDIFTIPNMRCAVATDEYTRAPIKPGDKGYVIAADYYMGGMTGLGGGTATFDKKASLSTVVFHPVGNTEFEALYDPVKYVIFGPDGVTLRNASGSVIINIGPVPDGPGNVMQLLDLVAAANDAEAAAKGVPLLGMYHDNGAVRVRVS